MNNEQQKSQSEEVEKIVPQEQSLPAMPTVMSSNQAANPNLLPISILIAAVMISGSIFYAVNRTPSGAPTPAQGGDVAAAPDLKALLTLGERDAILGDANAPVTLIEYSDFQCPFCGRFYSETEPQIRDAYVKTGKVKIVYRHLAFLGPESVEAAKASECAKDQGKFWAYHDELFKTEIKDGQEHNGNLDKDLFVKLAGTVGLNVSAFTQCYDSGTYASFVDDEVAKARAGGVNATPTVFVNGTVVQGAQPFSAFQPIIDAALAAK